MFVYKYAGAESLYLMEEAEAMGFVGSELEGFIGDHHKDAKRDGKDKEQGPNQSEPAEVEKQLRHLRMESEVKPAEKLLKMKAGVQGECCITTHNRELVQTFKIRL